MTVQIPVDLERVAAFCRRHHIRKLALFGSVLRSDFSDQSDVDVLVEFEPQHIPGLIRLAGMEIGLAEILGRNVDLRTPGDLSHYFRQSVQESALSLYVRG